MAAYNDIDGVPCTANEALLTGILRDEWRFDGIVMADMFAVDRLRRAGLSPAASGAVALRAGVDMSMCDISFAALEEAVTSGLVPESLVDRACARVLGLKVRLGLLDDPAPVPSFPAPYPAAEMVASAPVLLQNRDQLLPLAERPQRIAVIGPNADDLPSLLGDYVPPLAAGAGVSVLAGIRALAIADVRHERGCTRTEPIDGGLARVRRGTQLVQLYARVHVAGLLPRRAMLAGFTHVTLDPGETAEVRVAVDPDARPCLGIPPGTEGRLELWLSTTGAGDPVSPCDLPFDPFFESIKEVRARETDKSRRVLP
jgi:hypothetical protein